MVRTVFKNVWLGWLGAVLSGSIALAGDAGVFSFPVGEAGSPPTVAPSANEYRITQGFNTSVEYLNGAPDGGWCMRNAAQDDRYRDKTACEGAGGRWYYGHTGVDLANGASGGDIRAMAYGIVRKISRNVDSWGNLVRIEHTLPSGEIVYSQSGHMLRIDAAVQEEVPVVAGQKIGEVGTTGNSTSPHLHLEVKKDNTNGPGYLFDDAGNQMKSFLDPLLFIDDRAWGQTIALAPGWTAVKMPFNAVSPTAYVAYQGKNSSLQKAVQAGLLYKYVYVNVGEQWYYYSDIERIAFEVGQTYWIYAFTGPTALHLFAPGNDYPAARARQDMVAAAERDGRLGAAHRETYGENPNWNPAWALQWMRFRLTGSATAVVDVYHASSTSNPLVRVIGYVDPVTGTWTGWKQVF